MQIVASIHDVELH